jgi:hypothetical protein
MGLLCGAGLHRWDRYDTARPGTSVYRCRRCGKRTVLHGDRRRLPKRYVFLAAGLLSAAMWFVIVNLTLYGHTGVVRTTSAAVDEAETMSGRLRRVVHKLQGDSGSYVDPTPAPDRKAD